MASVEAVDTEMFIEFVKSHPEIWNIGSEDYKDKRKRDAAWEEISKNLVEGFEEKENNEKLEIVEDCKKRWKNTKDNYHKRRRNGKATTPSIFTKSKQWPLFEMLSFLNQVDHKRQSISNIENDDVSNQNDTDDPLKMDDTQNASEQIYASCSSEDIISSPRENPVLTRNSFRPPNKRKKQFEEIIRLIENRRSERNEILKDLTQNQDDEIDLFFKSIAMSVKKLRPELVHEAKLKSLQLMFDLENRNTSLPSLPSPSQSSISIRTSSWASNVNDNYYDHSSDLCSTDFKVLKTESL